MKKRFCLFVAVLLFSAVPLMAASGSYVIGSGFETQSKSNWCWAACAVNINKVENNNVTRSQNAIVYHIVGASWGDPYDPYPNVMVSLSNARAAADYASYGSVSYTAVANALGFSQIVDKIDANHPNTAGMLTPGGGTAYGHFVLIRGWKELPSGMQYVNIHNPQNGATNYCLYSSFLNGMAINGFAYAASIYRTP